MKTILPLLIVASLRWVDAVAQRGGIVFTRMTKENGLASSRINTIVKDHRGYYWIGSASGLQRFDGKRMVNFQHDPKDPSSIPANSVFLINEDNQNRLWLNIAGYPYMLDAQRRNFTKIPVEHSGQSTLNISTFFQDAAGLLWMMVSGMEPFVLDSVTNVFKPYTSIWPSAPSRVIELLYDEKRNCYWVDTYQGFMIYDPRTKTYYYRDHNPQNLRCFHDSDFLGPQGPVHKDPNDIIWTQYWGRTGGWGHFRYDIKKDEVTRIDLNYHLWGFMTDHSGTTWCYGDSLAYFDNKTKAFVRVLPKKNSLYGIDFNEIYYMFEDEEHNIWAITNLGLYFFNLQRQYFNTTDALWSYRGKAFVEGNTTGFIETNDGNLISLSWGGDGLNFFDSAYSRIPPLYGFNPNDFKDPEYLLAWCGFQDSRGLIWVGCQHGHLLRLDPANHKVASFVPREFENLTIRSIAEDQNGDMWFGTQRNLLVKWTRSFNTFKKVITGPYGGYPLDWVISILPGFQNDLWVGTTHGGLLHIDVNADRVIEHFVEDKKRTNSIGSMRVHDVIALNKDTLAIATAAGIDLFDWRRRQFTQLNKKDGLPSEGAISMVKDERNNIWFSNIDGVSKIHMPDKTVNNYGFADGILERNFMIGSSIGLRNKHIFFGNTAGFVSFEPDNITDEKTVPSDVMITGFRIFNQDLRVDSLLGKNKSVRLKHSENYISIQFASLGNILNNRPDYFYMLEGIDKDWIKASDNQEAIYTYLPSGSYTFKVRSVSRDGIPGKSITAFEIDVNPPFWKAWWFITLILAAASGIGYYIYLLKLRRRNERELIRNRIARDLHDDMGSTLSTINILSSMAKSKLNTDAVKTSEYINKIGDNSQRMMEAMDDIVWAIKPDNDSMQKIIARMREFATSVLEAKEIDIDFIVGENVNEIKLNMEQRKDFFLVFKESVNNVAKYSRCSRVKIQVAARQNRLVLIVKDDGVGFDPLAADNGNGLGNMQKRADALRGRLQLQSRQGEGTTVTLNIPVG